MDYRVSDYQSSLAKAILTIHVVSRLDPPGQVLSLHKPSRILLLAIVSKWACLDSHGERKRSKGYVIMHHDYGIVVTGILFSVAHS